MSMVFDLSDKEDLLFVVIVALIILVAGFAIGIMTASIDATMLQNDYNKLEAEVELYAEREFSIMLKGRKIEVWDSMGLIDSVKIGDGDGQDHKY